MDGSALPFIHSCPSSPSMSAAASASAADRPPPALTTSSPHGSNPSVSNFLRHSDSSTLTSLNDNASFVTFTAYAPRSSRASLAPVRLGSKRESAATTRPMRCRARRTAFVASFTAPSSPKSRKLLESENKTHFVSHVAHVQIKR